MGHAAGPMEEVEHCTVETGGVWQCFSSVTPLGGGTLRRQTQEAMEVIDEIVRQDAKPGFVCQQTVFLADMQLAEEFRRVLRDFYGPDLPATTLVPQRPCSGSLVAIEAIGIGPGLDPVEVQRLSDRVVTVRHSGTTWTYVGQAMPRNPEEPVYRQTRTALEAMSGMLQQANMRLDQVVRTWLYLGGIVGLEGTVERYRELNRARTDYYQPHRFGGDLVAPGVRGAVYPASTGIGADDRNVLISGIALATTRNDLRLVPLENPNQVSAFDYAPKYGAKSPKFARAMAVTYGGCATIFISGTASITASESRHLDDAAAQTRQTLDNIAALISESNFRQHGMPGFGATPADLASLRVYVKRAEDYARVRAACEAQVGKVPTIYTVADVCRPELLVEIEGVAFSQQAQ
jgi:enamine deaminase RidA (YjgF/YER057c/UK114 family)